MTQHDRKTGSTDGKIERAKDQALGMHDDNPGVADHVGEAAGGITGVTAGAAAGSLAGPVGTIIGGIAGAMAGWWTGRAVAEAATAISSDDDAYYRKHYESHPNRPADKRYEDVRPAYYLGHIASRNPEYRERNFGDIESTLGKGWESQPDRGSWTVVRIYADEGFKRGRTGAEGASKSVGTSDSAGAKDTERRF